MKIKKPLETKHITLIEVLVVLSLIMLVGGVIGINIQMAIREQKFRTEVNQVVDTLRTAQNLMLITGENVHVKFSSSSNFDSIKCEIELDDPLPWMKFLQKPLVLQQIFYVGFKDEEQQEQRLDLKFVSKGSVMSQGVLRLSTNVDEGTKGGLNRYICLGGYPRPIDSLPSRPNSSCVDFGSADFDKKLTLYTIQEIRQELEEGEKPSEEEDKKEQPPEKKQNEVQKIS